MQLSAQRESAALCQRQFDEAGMAWRAAQDCVVARPEQARQHTEGLTRALLDKMLVDGDMCIRLLTCNAGDNASAHAMNVAVISLLMGRVFGFGDDEMLDLGIGALMHDVGKIDLAERLRHPDERFGPDDLAAYRNHVAHGVVHGKRMGLRPRRAAGAGAAPRDTPTASGFPLRLKIDRMSVAARIVALVNRYDKLCNPPVLGLAHTPHEALSLLFAQAKSQFDASMLNSFIRMMGVYPAGSVVQLTDDRYALVMSVNSTRPLKPNVLVHDPGLPRDEALHLNLMCTPELGIRRSLKPAQLPADALRLPGTAAARGLLLRSDARRRGAGRGSGGCMIEAAAPPVDDDQARVRAWSALVDSLPDATWIVDAHSRCVVADNAAARALLGRAGGSLVGQQAEALIATPEDLAFWDAAAAGDAAALQSRHHAVRCRRAHLACHAQHPPAAERRARRGTAPLRGGGQRPQRAAPRRGRTRAGGGRAAGHAGIHRRRHPGDRPAGPHPRLQPPLRPDLGHPRGPAEGAPGRRGARLDAAQRARRRGLPAPAAAPSRRPRCSAPPSG